MFKLSKSLMQRYAAKIANPDYGKLVILDAVPTPSMPSKPSSESILLGYKGQAITEAGYFYAPYVPLHTSGNILPEVGSRVHGPYDFGIGLRETDFSIGRVFGVVGLVDSSIVHAIDRPGITPLFVVSTTSPTEGFLTAILTDGDQWWEVLNKLGDDEWMGHKISYLSVADREAIRLSLREFVDA